VFGQWYGFRQAGGASVRASRIRLAVATPFRLVRSLAPPNHATTRVCPAMENSEIGFGRAVSRILSASLRTERIICLSDRYPKPVSLSRNAERAAPGFPIWPCTRWGFPCRPAHAGRGGLLHHLFTLTGKLAFAGGLIFCGTFRRKVFQLSARVYLRPNRSYAASRPAVFGLSSPVPHLRDRSDPPPFQNHFENKRLRKNLKPLPAQFPNRDLALTALGASHLGLRRWRHSFIRQ